MQVALAHGARIAKIRLFCLSFIFSITIYGRLLTKTRRNRYTDQEGDVVDTNRRDALKLGASAAVS